MQRGREQSHTTERTTSASTGRGKFYFPTNRKHETPHSPRNILLYTYLFVWQKSARQYCEWKIMILLHSMEKGDCICWLQVMSPAVEIQQSKPWLEEQETGKNWGAEIKFLLLSLAALFPTSPAFSPVVRNRNDHTSQALSKHTNNLEIDANNMGQH